MEQQYCITPITDIVNGGKESIYVHGKGGLWPMPYTKIYH